MNTIAPKYVPYRYVLLGGGACRQSYSSNVRSVSTTLHKQLYTHPSSPPQTSPSKERAPCICRYPLSLLPTLAARPYLLGKPKIREDAPPPRYGLSRGGICT